MYIIGLSAGGTAAVNALLEYPSKVKRVVAVASPLMRDFSRNSVLSASYTHMHNHFPRAGSLRGRILSAYGSRDQLVPPVASQLPQAHLLASLPGWSHNIIIVAAMTLRATTIARWLKRGKL